MLIAEGGSGDSIDLLLLDCDVVEPNAALFLKPTLTSQEVVGVMFPRVDHAKFN